MEAATWGFLGAIVGAMVGALSSIATTLISNRQAARLQTASHEVERSERSRVLQRDTLLSLQDELLTHGRFGAQIYMEDLSAYRESGTWGRRLINEDISEGSRMSNARMSSLIERVAHDSLRESLRGLQSRYSSYFRASTQEGAETILNGAIVEQEAVMKQLGEVLRSQY